MSYSLNRGVDGDGLDNTQRGLLIGLPAIALILGFGAIHKHLPGGQASAHTIPVVSSLKTGGGTNNNGSSANNPQTATDASGTDISGSAAASSAPGSVSSGTGGGVAATTGGGTITGSGGVVGGRGGGPTGGGTTTGGTGGSGGTTAGGGGVTVPTCSLNQIATVNCMVPACSPAVTLAPGQKAILGVAGTCVVLN